MRERLLAIPAAARTRLRLSTEAVHALDTDGFERLTGEIKEWIDLDGHLLAEDHPEWSRSAVTTTSEARKAFDMVNDLAYKHLPAARDALFNVLDEIPLPKPETVAEWDRTARFLVVAIGSRWARIRAQITSKEYRMTKQALGAPSALSLSRGQGGRSGKARKRSRRRVFLAFAGVAGIDDLEGDATYGSGHSVGKDGIQPNRGREPFPYP